jgi:CAAX protease family protein
MNHAFSRHRLAAEFTLVFLGLPLLGWWQSNALKRWIIPQILVVGLASMLVLWRDQTFDRRILLAMPGRWPPVLRIVSLFLVGGAVLLGLAAWSGDVDLFRFPRERPGRWLAVLLLYPLVSALAQEVIFRVFLFHRYRTLFSTPGRMVTASALVFALAHLILDNWLAPVLALVGGLLFGWTYLRTRSLLLVTLEHGMWGNWLFTVGLGQYFYGGHL